MANGGAALQRPSMAVAGDDGDDLVHPEAVDERVDDRLEDDEGVGEEGEDDARLDVDGEDREGAAVDAGEPVEDDRRHPADQIGA